MWTPWNPVRRADRLAATGRPREALRVLRRLSLARFGRLMLEVPERYPALRSLLPDMPPEQVQLDWTGQSGRGLLLQTHAFVRSVENAFSRLTGRALHDAVILDYGCGWGRVLRLIYRFAPLENVYAVDPCDTALEICRAHRVLGNLAACDYVPRGLPFGGVTFDLVYALSVFTHLSERTADAVLTAIRSGIRRDGLLALTVRPVEYWDVHPAFPEGSSAGALRAAHVRDGFAFLPQHRPPVDGDITFGETSMSLDYVRRRWTAWQLVGHETNEVDPYQQILFLRPR